MNLRNHRILVVAVGTPVTRCPRTNPYVQHYRIRLLPQVMTPKRATGKGCFGTCLG